MNGRTWGFCFLVVAALGVRSGFAAEAERPARSVLETVAALAKPVTYSETKIPLGELVRKVAAETNVPLTAAREVADEPVAVVVKEMPARALLEQLAELLDYQWSRRGVGQAVSLPSSGNRQADSLLHYEIYQDLASKQREEALRQALFDDVERRFQEAVNRVIELSSLGQEEIDALIAKGEQRRQELQTLPADQQQVLRNSPAERRVEARLGTAEDLWSPINRGLAKLIGRLSAQHWTAVRRGEPIMFSSTPTPGEFPLPADTLRTFQDTAFRLRRPRDLALPPDEAEEEQRRDQRSREQWSGASGYQVAVWLDRNRAMDELQLFVNASPLRQGTPVQEFWGGENAWLEIGAGTGDLKLQQRAEENTPERRAFLEGDPVFGARKVFNPKPANSDFPGRPYLQQYLPEVARVFGVQILSDAYWRSASPGPPPSPDPVARFALLDRLTGNWHRWDHRGKVVRLRHRTWFLERPREIPLRIVRRWQGSCERYGALQWQDVVESRVTLTDVQRESLLTGLIERLGLPWDFGGNGSRAAPLLYNALAPAQRERLSQGQTLPLGEMTPAQRAFFLGPLREATRYNLRYHLPPVAITDGTAANLSLKSERLLRTREQQGDVVRYQDQPAASPGNAPASDPVAAPRAPQSRSSGRTASPATAAPVTQSTRHYLVTRLRFSFQYSPETRMTEEVTVASPP